MESERKENMKLRFYAKLDNEKINVNSFLMNEQKIAELIEEVKARKSSDSKKVPRGYWLNEHYDVINIQGIEKLIVPVTNEEDEIKYYCSKEMLFDVLYDCHTAIGHGGRDRMVTEINRRYKNITRKQVLNFINLCELCQQKRSGIKKGIVVKPIISTHMNSRCQVDLIDFQSQPDGEFKFIFVYQDHLTKFVVLRPLTSKRAEEVAAQLLDVFLLLGAPCILQSDNGREFVNRIINELKVCVSFM